MSTILLSNMQVARRHHASFIIDGKVYVSGGNNENFLNIVEKYDPTLNIWTYVSSMQTSRSRHASFVIAEKAYVVGGRNGSDLNTVEKYDPTSNTWVYVANLPTILVDHAAFTIDTYGYVAGGYGNVSGILKTVEKYDPMLDTWTRIAPMQTARNTHAVFVIYAKAFVAGGQNGSGSLLNTVEKYDPVENTWFYVESMQTTRRYHAAFVIGGKGYAIGGVSSSAILNTVEKYDPVLNKWTYVASLSDNLWGHTAFALNDFGYTVGGRHDGFSYSYINTIIKYNPKLDEWNINYKDRDRDIYVLRRDIQYKKHIKKTEPMTITYEDIDITSKYPVFNIPENTGRFSLPHSFRVPKEFFYEITKYRILENANIKHEFFRLYGSTNETSVKHLYELHDYTEGILLINNIPIEYTDKQVVVYNNHTYVESKNLDIVSIHTLHVFERSLTNATLFIDENGVINTNRGIGICSSPLKKYNAGSHVADSGTTISENYIKVDNITGKLTTSGTVTVYNNKAIVITGDITVYAITFNFTSIFDRLYDRINSSKYTQLQSINSGILNKYSSIFNNAYLYPNITTVLDKAVKIGSNSYVPGFVERHIIQDSEDLKGYTIREEDCILLAKNNIFIEDSKIHNLKLLIPVIQDKGRQIVLYLNNILYKCSPEIIYHDSKSYILIDICDVYGWEYTDYFSSITKYKAATKHNVFDIAYIDDDDYVFEEYVKPNIECVFLPLKVFEYLKTATDIVNIDVYANGRILKSTQYEIDFFGITDTSNNAVQIPALYLNVHAERVTVICRKTKYTVTEFIKDSPISGFLLPACAEYPEVFYNDGSRVSFSDIVEVFPGNFDVKVPESSKLFVKYKKIISPGVIVEDINMTALYSVEVSGYLRESPSKISHKDTYKYMILLQASGIPYNTNVERTVKLTAASGKTSLRANNHVIQITNLNSILDLSISRNLEYVSALMYSFWCRSLVSTYFTTKHQETLYGVVKNDKSIIQNKNIHIPSDTVIIDNYNSFFNSIGYNIAINKDSFNLENISESINIFDIEMFDSLVYHHFNTGLIPDEWCHYIRKNSDMLSEASQSNNVESKITLSMLMNKNGIGNILVLV